MKKKKKENYNEKRLKTAFFAFHTLRQSSDSENIETHIEP